MFWNCIDVAPSNKCIRANTWEGDAVWQPILNLFKPIGYYSKSEIPVEYSKIILFLLLSGKAVFPPLLLCMQLCVLMTVYLMVWRLFTQTYIKRIVLKTRSLHLPVNASPGCTYSMCWYNTKSTPESALIYIKFQIPSFVVSLSSHSWNKFTEFTVLYIFRQHILETKFGERISL